MPSAANLLFTLRPLLTDDTIKALLTTGTEERKQLLVLELTSGEWTGTMNLTELQASSDLALVHTCARPVGNGAFKVFGTKTFVTWGEHDMAENIVHLILARIPGAPEGTKGVSLFVVSKLMVNPDGSLGVCNDAHCVSIEHKLGVKTSPTAVLQSGGNSDAIGTLVGEENHGLEYMFIMTNATRYAVDMQGIGVSRCTYQKAVAYTHDRAQSRPVDGSATKAVPITHHPDVKRMLLTIRAMTEGACASAYVATAACDTDRYSTDDTTCKQNAVLYEFPVSIVKGWSTEMSIDVTNLDMQVYDGVGFIEETGAVQFYRDARILSVYEGTTAIQANDLIGRKTVHDEDTVALGIYAEIARMEVALAARGGTYYDATRTRLVAGCKVLGSVVRFVVEQVKVQPNAVFVGSVSYLRLYGIVPSGWQIAYALPVAIDRRNEDPNFYGMGIIMACVFAGMLLTQAPGIAQSILTGGEAIGAVSGVQF